MVQCGAATGCSAGHMQLQLHCPGQLGRCRAGRPVSRLLVQQRCCTQAAPRCCCCCTVASLGSAAALLHPPCVRQLQQHKDFCPALSRTLPRGKRGAVAHPQPSSGMQYHLQRTSAPAKLQARPRSRGVPSDEHCCYAITGCVLLNCD